MNRAISLLESELNLSVREFTVAGIRHESLFAHKWYIGTDSALDPIVARDRIDANLKILNDDYRVERIAAIKDVIVEVLPSAVFYDWMRSKGKEGAQNKFPRVLNPAQHEEWQSFVRSHQTLGSL
jgi:hypothetical protein